MLTPLLGNAQRLDGGAMFGNAPRAVWSRWAAPDEANRIDLACRCLLVRSEDKIVLLETGIGAFFPPALRERFGVTDPSHVLLASLAQAGVQPADVDVVVLSHLHFDHAGGLLTPWSETDPPALVFDNATFVVGRRAWHRAIRPHPRDRASFVPDVQRLLEASGRMVLVDAPPLVGEPGPATTTLTDVLGPGYRAHTSDGHTPGMLHTEIDTADGPLVFVADLIPGTPWVHLPITMGYDRFPERLIDEKRSLLDDLHPRSGRLFYTHDPDVAWSGIEQDERGRYRAASPT